MAYPIYHIKTCFSRLVLHQRSTTTERSTFRNCMFSNRPPAVCVVWSNLQLPGSRHSILIFDFNCHHLFHYQRLADNVSPQPRSHVQSRHVIQINGDKSTGCKRLVHPLPTTVHLIGFGPACQRIGNGSQQRTRCNLPIKHRVLNGGRHLHRDSC